MRANTEPWHWCGRGVQNNTKFVFQVAAGTSCLKAYLVDEAKARHPTAFVTQCSYVVTDRPFYTAASTSAVGDPKWTEAFADGVTGEIILSTAVRGSTSGGVSRSALPMHCGTSNHWRVLTPWLPQGRPSSLPATCSRLACRRACRTACRW